MFYSLNYSFFFLVKFIEWLINKIFVHLSEKALKETKSSQMFTLVVQIYIFQVLVNTGMVIFLFNYWFVDNKAYSEEYQGLQGLISVVATVQKTNMVLSPIIRILDPLYLYRKVRRFFYQRRAAQNKLDPETKWKDIKHIFEPIEYSHQSAVTKNLRIITVALFFSPIFPLGLLYSIIEIILFYLFNRLLIIKRCKTPSELSFKFCENVMILLEMSLVVWAVGLIYFEYVLDKKVSIGTCLIGALSLVQIFFLSCRSMIFSRQRKYKVKNTL